MTIPDWDQYFIMLAYAVAMRSKDEATKIGAVIVGPDKEIVSTGYNSFVRGINDGIPGRQMRPKKYFWFEHAERNAVYNAARIGVSTKGCTMYIPGFPCADCARAIVQSGIGEIVLHEAWDGKGDTYDDDWVMSLRASEEMFHEAGVRIRKWAGRIPAIKACKRGKNIIE